MITKGATLTCIDVHIGAGMSVEKVDVEEVTVGLVNEEFLVIEDRTFTQLHQPEVSSKRSYGYPKVNEVSLTDYTGDKLMARLMGEIRISLYTTHTLKVAQNRINRELNKHIQKKCGVYGFAKEVVIELEDK